LSIIKDIAKDRKGKRHRRSSGRGGVELPCPLETEEPQKTLPVLSLWGLWRFHYIDLIASSLDVETQQGLSVQTLSILPLRHRAGPLWNKEGLMTYDYTR
jgi:hypothetical protein